MTSVKITPTMNALDERRKGGAPPPFPGSHYSGVGFQVSQIENILLWKWINRYVMKRPLGIASKELLCSPLRNVSGLCMADKSSLKLRALE